MSYTPPEQSLAGPLGQILDGIKAFDEAVQARIASGAWTQYHIDEIHDLSVKLMRLRVELSKLKRGNW